jgi:hypothetical protein
MVRRIFSLLMLKTAQKCNPERGKEVLRTQHQAVNSAQCDCTVINEQLSRTFRQSFVLCGPFCRAPRSQWWSAEVLQCLPRAYDEVTKNCSEIVQVNRHNEMVDGYFDYHRPYEFSLLSEMYAYKISHSIRYIINNIIYLL